MSPLHTLLTRERVASIREVQQNPSRALQGMTRVMRGSKTIGFFFANEDLDELLEDVEAASSPTLRRRVAAARKGSKGKKTASAADLAKRYGM